MANRKPSVVFMGTPRFAVPSLSLLINNGFQILSVVTVPDKPAGRGRKIKESEVKIFALSKGLKVMQPASLKDPGFIDELDNLKADFFVVVAFRMLPEVVWNIPPFGTINLHSSLLPQYRGAAPVNHAIINGEKETGITTFYIGREIDTGSILLQERLSIGTNETAGELHDRLMVSGASLLLRTLELVYLNEIKPVSQIDLMGDGITLKPAPKLSRESCRIQWNQPANTIFNHIRGLSPYPGAWTTLKGAEKDLVFKITSSEIVVGSTENELPGKINISDGNMYVETAYGTLNIKEIQPEGKRTMLSSDFLRGFKLSDNMMFA